MRLAYWTVFYDWQLSKNTVLHLPVIPFVYLYSTQSMDEISKHNPYRSSSFLSQIEVLCTDENKKVERFCCFTELNAVA